MLGAEAYDVGYPNEFKNSFWSRDGSDEVFLWFAVYVSCDWKLRVLLFLSLWLVSWSALEVLMFRSMFMFNTFVTKSSICVLRLMFHDVGGHAQKLCLDQVSSCTSN